jgi:hypothetical protein
MNSKKRSRNVIPEAENFYRTILPRRERNAPIRRPGSSYLSRDALSWFFVCSLLSPQNCCNALLNVAPPLSVRRQNQLQRPLKPDFPLAIPFSVRRLDCANNDSRRSVSVYESETEIDIAMPTVNGGTATADTENDVGSEGTQVVGHDESHEDVAAASYPMNSDSEQTSRDDGSANKHSQNRSTLRGAAWEDRLSELADYCKVHGHCNVPQRYSENIKLGTWVKHQRNQYRLHLKGETSQITLPRIQALESLSFEWGSRGANCPWEDRLSELADYRKVHGHCNVPKGYSENIKLARWIAHQRSQYCLHLKGNKSQITLPRIEALESLGFEWDSRGTAWEDRLSELADFRKVHRHCNVPQKYSENVKLGKWVGYQRYQYSLHQKGKTSPLTLPRIQVLESLGFKWGSRNANWDDRLSELADFRKVHGHCNVPRGDSQNTKLSWWVASQRRQYSLRLKEKPSLMTLFRIQALESLGFEWGGRGSFLPVSVRHHAITGASIGVGPGSMGLARNATSSAKHSTAKRSQATKDAPD